MIRRLLIRPGAIGDFILSLPALEFLRADYTEVWCSSENVPLARFADCARSITSVGLDRLGFFPAENLKARLRSFHSIVSWYGTNNPEFRALLDGYPVQFLPALPDGRCHAADFYCRQVGAGGTAFPKVRCPDARREFAVIHPFASSAEKRSGMDVFRKAASELETRMPVHWLRGPEEELEGAIHIDDLYELACFLRRARIFVGNDSGITHLAAAVGTPVLALFRSTTSRVWTPRGSAVAVSHVSVSGD